MMTRSPRLQDLCVEEERGGFMHRPMKLDWEMQVSL